MTAEVGQCVGNGGECVIYRKALYAAARALALLTVHGNDNGRFSVFSAKPCGNYSYYALVPIFTRHHYDACIFFVGTALYFRYRLLCYLVFNAVTLFIVSVYCFASSAASFSSSLSKRRNAVMAEPILPAAFMRGAKVKDIPPAPSFLPETPAAFLRASNPWRLPEFIRFKPSYTRARFSFSGERHRQEFLWQQGRKTHQAALLRRRPLRRKSF